MVKLEWKAYYSVGVKELDKQHLELLQLINNLQTVKQELTIEKCFSMLNELVQYAQEHFESEENLMTEYGYNDLESHMAEHEAFTMKVFELNQDLEKNGIEIFPGLVEFLKQWYLEHVLGVDKAYQPFFEKKGVK